MRPVEQASIRQTAARSREPREGKPRGEKGLIFHTLKQIADAIVATFPRAFEVVVHDLFQPQKRKTVSSRLRAASTRWRIFWGSRVSPSTTTSKKIETEQRLIGV